jgi:Ca2+-binding EF-hand superfamily protein
MDANHDGAVSREEWVAYGGPAADFTAVDADKDGRVTVAELRAFWAAHATTDADRAALEAENPKFDPEITIRMADTNRDGGVSEEEWVAYGGHGGRGFTPIDANHDGEITAGELAAYRDAHKPR